MYIISHPVHLHVLLDLELWLFCGHEYSLSNKDKVIVYQYLIVIVYQYLIVIVYQYLKVIVYQYLIVIVYQYLIVIVYQYLIVIVLLI